MSSNFFGRNIFQTLKLNDLVFWKYLFKFILVYKVKSTVALKFNSKI